MTRKHAEDYFDHVAALRRQGLNQNGSTRPMTRIIPSAKQMEDSRKTHYFRDDDGERVVVITELLPNGEYAAWIDGEGDGTHGLGDTMMEAISDLHDHLVELI